MNAKTFAALAGAMRKDAAVGQKTVSGLLNWNGGAHSTMIVRNFVIPADEPAALGGTDRGASPMELVLAGLMSCVAVSIAYSAAEEGIDLHAIAIDVEGDIDLRGLFGVADDVRPGFEEVRLIVRVDADAPEETIEDLVHRGYRRSPAVDSLTGRVPVRVCIGREGI